MLQAHLHQNFNLPKFRIDLNPSGFRPLNCGRTTFLSDNEGLVERMREMFDKVKISVSAYDTAWAAMVASREFPEKPCFPQCLKWVMENQDKDGSWNSLQLQQPIRDRLLVKDSLMSTLACVLALRKWRLGDQLLLKGLEFIGSNVSAACDPLQLSPVGFDVLFPGMIKHARELDLNLPLDKTLWDCISHNYEIEIARIRENEAASAYLAEGLGTLCSWEKVFKDERTNDSLRRSPAAAAAALNHQYDHKLFAHLSSILNKCEEGAPTIHPSNVYVRLKTIDVVEKLGLKRYFTHEIDRVLQEAYRSWHQRDEEVFSDVNCCAMAFRLLRSGGYEVCQDELLEFIDEKCFFSKVSPQFTTVTTIIELYRASQSIISGEEDILEKINTWTGTYLKQQLCKLDTKLHKEVEFTLRNYHGSLERVVNRKCIELFDGDEFQMLKSCYRYLNIPNRDLLTLSIQDFNSCQALHQDELEKLERWFEKNRLHHMNIPRRAVYSSYFMIAADVFEPELSAVRTSFAQTILLIRAVDDLFDNTASREELLSIIGLVKEWDSNKKVCDCSEQVEIFFLALYTTIEELAEKAFIHQGRCIKQHLISMWVELLDGMMIELDWWRESRMLNMEEYLSVTCSTIGGHVCILTGIYFVGPMLSEEVIGSEEIRSLCKYACTIARLLNDVQTFEKELSERKPNSLSLLVHQGMSIEEARTKIERMVESSRRELLRMVIQKKRSLVPRECKNLFLTTSKTSFYLYNSSNEYDCPNEIINDTKSVFFDTIQCHGQKEE